MLNENRAMTVTRNEWSASGWVRAEEVVSPCFLERKVDAETLRASWNRRNLSFLDSYVERRWTS